MTTRISLGCSMRSLTSSLTLFTVSSSVLEGELPALWISQTVGYSHHRQLLTSGPSDNGPASNRCRRRHSVLLVSFWAGFLGMSASFVFLLSNKMPNAQLFLKNAIEMDVSSTVAIQFKLIDNDTILQQSDQIQLKYMLSDIEIKTSKRLLSALPTEQFDG